ncbi:MAG TPA: MFS transporter [Ktedonobacterales bacterium]|nr:MFS transporter [Ktedonobacterales bacterium]
MSSLDTGTRQATPPSDDTGALPPAAARANLITVGAAHAVIHGVSILMPLIFPILHTQYGFSYTEIGLIGTVSGLAGGVLQVVFGYISRVVPRKVLIGVGNLIVALATFLTATAVTFVPWLGWSALRRVGGAPQHPAGNSILTDSYGPRRRGFAIAAHVAGGNIGTLLVPIVGAAIIKFYGWQPALIVFALPGLAAGAAVLLLTREPPQPDTASAAEKPDDAGSPRTFGARLATLLAPLRHRGVILVILASMVAAGGRGLGILTKYLPLYMLGPIKLPQATVTGLYTLLLAGSVAGPLLAGRISDRTGRRPMLWVAYGLAALFTLLVPVVFGSGAPLVALIVEIGLLGLVVYCESPLLQAYLVDNSEPAQRDAAVGWYFTLAFGIGSLWDVILGSMIDRTGSFIPAFLLMAASYVAAATILLFIPRDQRDERR